MPVYSEEAIPLINELKKADELESVAIKALSDYMESGGGDKLAELTKEMEQSHNNKMAIYNKMQSYRLDE